MLRNPAIAASLSVLMLILFLMPGASWLFPEEENTTTPLAAEQPLHHNSKATLPVDKAVLSAENKTTSVPISKVKVQEQKTPAYAAVQSLRTVVNEELNDIAVNKTTNNDNGMTESVIIPTNLSFVPNQQLLQMPISMPIVFNPAMQIPQNPISLPAQRLFGGKIELGVRGTSFASRSFPSPEISPLTDPPLNNIAFSVQYNISEEHSISFEAGQESFRQEFYRLEGNDSLAYKQHLLDGWGAVGYRFSPNDLSLSNTLRPFAKISIGATSVGALARLGIGISADLTQQLSCQIQAEGTGLWYNVEGVLFSTRQVGLSYGFSYRL
jgi:hypothetical protein